VNQNGLATLELVGGSQTALSALVVNNIVGLSQVANGVNVLAASVGLNPGLPALQFTQSTGLTSTLSQTNTINQFRGTPYSRPAAP